MLESVAVRQREPTVAPAMWWLGRRPRHTGLSGGNSSSLPPRRNPTRSPVKNSSIGADRSQQFTHIKLNKGSGAPMRDGERVCANHGAYFEQDTGHCTFGPCEGAYLEDIGITVRDGSVFLTDDTYEFVEGHAGSPQLRRRYRGWYRGTRPRRRPDRRTAAQIPRDASRWRSRRPRRYRHARRVQDETEPYR
jgi:hypothetical protein